MDSFSFQAYFYLHEDFTLLNLLAIRDYEQNLY